MSLTLESTDASLSARLDEMAKDGSTSPVELQAIRDDADRRALDATGISTGGSALALAVDTARFLLAADDVVEIMQKIALDARKSHLPDDKRQLLKSAVEAQLAYIVAGYQSSIQRL